MKFKDYIFENIENSFNKHLLNEDYMRFLNKNKNLTRQQKNEINDYFYKVNPHAGKKINWQSKDMQNWTYQDFMDLKQKYKSGIKSSKHLRCDKIKVPISSDQYIRIKMHTKEFCAFIPLTYEAAKVFNTRKLGVCSGPWCIGSTETSYHWNDIVIDDKEVPIYVINNTSKWVVMIKPGNRTYDVWDVKNDYRRTKEEIPGFSIRNNLLTSSLKTMYDDLRRDYFDDKETIDVTEELEEFENLVGDMESAREEYLKGYENFIAHNENIKEKTLEAYEDKLDKIDDEIDETKDEIDETKDDDKIKELENKLDNLKQQKLKIEDDIDSIENMSEHDMYDEADIEWVDEPMREDEAYENFHYPDIHNYKNYINLMEDHGLAGRDLNEILTLFIVGEYGSDVSAEEVLSQHGWYDPEVINNL